MSLLERMKSNYINIGFVHDGAVIPHTNEDKKEIEILLKEGFIEKANLSINAYRLNLKIRKNLVKEFSLLETWVRKNSLIYKLKQDSKGNIFEIR